MKQNLDPLMRARGLDAMVVYGKLNGNPALYYMANGARVIQAHIVKKLGSDPVFISSPIDREEARASGWQVLTTNDFDYQAIVHQTADNLSAQVELLRRIFERLGIRGKVGFYGMFDQAGAWALLNAVSQQIEGIEVVGEYDRNMIDIARSTKDDDEAARIKDVGRRTELVFGHTVEFLQSHKVEDEVLVQADGTPLTLGHVHQQINLLLTQQGLDVPESIIFSMGRDAGVPHNKGTAGDWMRLGKSIIFDMGTREMNGGYYYDMTRTFSLGYATDEVQKAYEDVKFTIESIIASYEVGASVRRYQTMAFDILESRGYDTSRSIPGGHNGFVTGLGHGIGLAVHEEPFFGDQPSNPNILTPGQIFTCEPGLYYPDKGWGVRIEDVIWIDSMGVIHDTTSFPKELVVKMK